MKIYSIYNVLLNENGLMVNSTITDYDGVPINISTYTSKIKIWHNQIIEKEGKFVQDGQDGIIQALFREINNPGIYIVQSQIINGERQFHTNWTHIRVYLESIRITNGRCYL